MPTTAREWHPRIVRAEEQPGLKEMLVAREHRFLAPLIKPDSRILDAGCGEGRNVIAFAQAGAAVVGIDSSRAVIDALLVEAERRNLPNVVGVTGSLLNLPFADGSFTLCTSVGVCQHFSKSQHGWFFKEAYRVLEPGGILYVEVPHFWSAWNVRRQAQYWAGKFGAQPREWEGYVSLRHLVDCGERAGFQLHASHVLDAWGGFEKGLSLDQEKWGGWPNPCNWFAPTLKKLSAWCEEREFLGRTVIYIGRKPRVRY